MKMGIYIDRHNYAQDILRAKSRTTFDKWTGADHSSPRILSNQEYYISTCGGIRNLRRAKWLLGDCKIEWTIK